MIFVPIWLLCAAQYDKHYELILRKQRKSLGFPDICDVETRHWAKGPCATGTKNKLLDIVQIDLYNHTMKNKNRLIYTQS